MDNAKKINPGNSPEFMTDSGHRGVEEINSTPALAPVHKTLAKTRGQPQAAIPNPLLEDPYDWERCTITIIISLLPTNSVTVSVQNHKDEPILDSFPAENVPLPEKINALAKTLREIWSETAISATIVLLPKSADSCDRAVIVSIRSGSDTPIVWSDQEANLQLPLVVHKMLDELQSLLPARALKHIERDARIKIAPTQISTAKVPPKSLATSPSELANAPKKTQLSLF